MESLEKSKSVFDILEEHSESPEIFSWLRDPLLFDYTPAEYLHDGVLFTIDEADGKLKRDRYVLTKNVLIRLRATPSLVSLS